MRKKRKVLQAAKALCESVARFVYYISLPTAVVYSSLSLSLSFSLSPGRGGGCSVAAVRRRRRSTGLSTDATSRRTMQEDFSESIDLLLLPLLLPLASFAPRFFLSFLPVVACTTVRKNGCFFSLSLAQHWQHKRRVASSTCPPSSLVRTRSKQACVERERERGGDSRTGEHCKPNYCCSPYSFTNPPMQ